MISRLVSTTPKPISFASLKYSNCSKSNTRVNKGLFKRLQGLFTAFVNGHLLEISVYEQLCLAAVERAQHACTRFQLQMLCKHRENRDKSDSHQLPLWASSLSGPYKIICEIQNNPKKVKDLNLFASGC